MMMQERTARYPGQPEVVRSGRLGYASGDARSPRRAAPLATHREGDPEASFAALQARLRPFDSTDDPARAEERTVLAIPSINLDQEVLNVTPGTSRH
jgi:hypothetical protein